METNDTRGWLRRAEEDDVTIPFIGNIAFGVGLAFIAEGWMEGYYLELVGGCVLTFLGAVGATQQPRRTGSRP